MRKRACEWECEKLCECVTMIQPVLPCEWHLTYHLLICSTSFGFRLLMFLLILLPSHLLKLQVMRWRHIIMSQIHSVHFVYESRSLCFPSLFFYSFFFFLFLLACWCVKIELLLFLDKYPTSCHCRTRYLWRDICQWERKRSNVCVCVKKTSLYAESRNFYRSSKHLRKL